MAWICSECRHGNHPECKGTVGGDTCVCPHPITGPEPVMFLYINFERTWRKREYFSSKSLDLQLCHDADIVVEFSDGRFSILKDRDGVSGSIELPVEVPFKRRS